MTASSTILRKLLLSALLLIVVSLASADFFLTGYTADREISHAVEVMQGQARILAPPLAALDRAGVAAWVSRAGEQSGARVTVIATDGVVLGDSQHDPSTMENHAGRPEIRVALAGGTGHSVRHSATLDADLCYLAIPATIQAGEHVILRLAVPLTQIAASIADVRWLIVRASLVAGVFALVIAFFVSRAFTKRIRRIQAFAGELVNADYSGTLAIESDDELGSVARSLREMADQFRGMLQRLSAEAAHRKAILASMVEGVLAVDRDLRVIFCNDSFASAVHARQPISGNLPLVELVRDPELLDLLKGVLAAGEPMRRRMTLVAARGRVFDVQAAALAGATGPAPKSGAIAILHDVTELEHLERVRRDFVANISHELRTPLASIRGYAETLRDSPPPDSETSRKFLGIICSNTVRMSDMASDLLALSEIETEREAPPLEDIAIREIAEDVIATVDGDARTRDVRVLMGEIPDVRLMGHRYRLEHALLNLLHNAIRYNRPGGEVWLEVTVTGGQVRIVVRDTGIGIPSHDLPRIFERFYCVDKARSRETGGTGLGLSIVKHVVEKMAGTVTVESRLGKGSAFTLSFPAALGRAATT